MDKNSLLASTSRKVPLGDIGQALIPDNVNVRVEVQAKNRKQAARELLRAFPNLTKREARAMLADAERKRNDDMGKPDNRGLYNPPPEASRVVHLQPNDGPATPVPTTGSGIAPRRSPNRANIRQKLAVARMLDVHCERLDDGMCRYADGWNDQKIADAVGDGVTAGHVQYIRQQEFGRIYAPRPAVIGGDDNSPLADRLMRAEAEIARLRAFVNALATKLGEAPMPILHDGRGEPS